jgi:hypothetical protein
MNNNSGDFVIQWLAIFVAISLFFIILVGFLNHFSLMENIEEEEKKKTIKMRAEEERKRLEIEAEKLNLHNKQLKLHLKILLSQFMEKRIKIEGEKAQQKARQIAQLQEEQQSLRIKAEKAEAERIRTQSQIWVI